MLEWIWFAVLTCIAMAVSSTLADYEEIDESTAGYIVTGLGLCAVYFSWPVLGQQVYNLLDLSITQNGTTIHTITVLVVMLLLLFCYMFAIIFLPNSIIEKVKTLAEKRKI